MVFLEQRSFHGRGTLNVIVDYCSLYHCRHFDYKVMRFGHILHEYGSMERFSVVLSYLCREGFIKQGTSVPELGRTVVAVCVPCVPFSDVPPPQTSGVVQASQKN